MATPPGYCPADHVTPACPGEQALTCEPPRHDLASPSAQVFTKGSGSEVCRRECGKVSRLQRGRIKTSHPTPTPVQQTGSGGGGGRGSALPRSSPSPHPQHQPVLENVPAYRTPRLQVSRHLHSNKHTPDLSDQLLNSTALERFNFKNKF